MNRYNHHGRCKLIGVQICNRVRLTISIDWKLLFNNSCTFSVILFHYLIILYTFKKKLFPYLILLFPSPISLSFSSFFFSFGLHYWASVLNKRTCLNITICVTFTKQRKWNKCKQILKVWNVYVYCWYTF